MGSGAEARHSLILFRLLRPTIDTKTKQTKERQLRSALEGRESLSSLVHIRAAAAAQVFSTALAAKLGTA